MEGTEAVHKVKLGRKMKMELKLIKYLKYTYIIFGLF